MGLVADSLVVVDTDLVIDFLRGRGDGVAVVRDLLRSARLRITAVTAYELRLGADFLRRSDVIMRLARSRTLRFDLRAALEAGRVAVELAARGTPIGVRDTLIAGTCLRHALPLATRNARHFALVDGLTVVRP